MKRASKILVLPDAHASPSYDNDRFDLIGKLIADERPDVVVSLGDFADMPSLSAYDRGKRAFEGRRYRLDCEATRDALERIRRPLRRLSKRPAFFITLGNHEHRIQRATNEHAELDGTIGYDDLGFADHGWEVLEYRDPLTIAGWSFAHEVAAGVMGRPCSSPSALLKNALSSTIVGHKHTLEEGLATRIDGTKVHAIIAGCYVHPRAREDWNRNTAHLAWNGVLILRDAENGECGELRRITQAQLKRVYRGGAA